MKIIENSLDHVSVDLGYGFVKAISKKTNKKVVFPSLVGRGHDLSISGMFDGLKKDISNIHVVYGGEEFFVGELAERESRTVSRVFEQERFDHIFTKVLLNVAIQMVTDGKGGTVNVSTGLPLDFYEPQKKKFRESLLGVQPHVEWKSGVRAGETLKLNINEVFVFPQGIGAVFSALYTNDGRYAYPHLMRKGNLIALIDIGFRTTDFTVVEIREDRSFVPNIKLSGTLDSGVVNLHRHIRQFYKTKTGGADLNEFHMSRIFSNHQLTYKGQKIDFTETILQGKSAVANNIADQLKAIWAEEADLFDAIFLAGGGGKLFINEFQSHFNDRVEIIEDSQFANAIGYLRLGNRLLAKMNTRNS